MITLHLTKYDNEVHTNTNSVELMIRVETLKAFLTPIQGFPVAWLILTTSFLPHFATI